MAVDISAACAGYCHGITMANDMVRGGSAENVLVVGVERLSDFTSRDDRGTAFIFGDGAGAGGREPLRDAGHRPDDLGLRRREVGGHLPDRELDRRPRAEARLAPHRHAGQTVFRWAVWGMAPVAQRALDAAGVTVDQLDAFVPHQANVRIVDAMAKQLGLPDDVAVARDIAYTGNTSAASVPLAMERMVRQGEIPGAASRYRSASAPACRMPRRSSPSPDRRLPWAHGSPGPAAAHPRRDRRSRAHGTE